MKISQPPAIAGGRGRMGYFLHDAAVPLVAARAQIRARTLRLPRTDRRSMSLLFAAIGATVTALVEVTLGDAAAHPVLVGGVIWTIAAGLDRGIAWAFVGGLLLDSLLGRPLGVSAFALLIAVGGAALLAQPLRRLRLVVPVIAVPILSLVYSMVLLALTSAARPGGSIQDPIGLLMPGVFLDALLGMFLGPLAVMLHDRRTATERVDWG